MKLTGRRSASGSDVVSLGVFPMWLTRKHCLLSYREPILTSSSVSSALVSRKTILPSSPLPLFSALRCDLACGGFDGGRGYHSLYSDSSPYQAVVWVESGMFPFGLRPTSSHAYAKYLTPFHMRYLGGRSPKW